MFEAKLISADSHVDEPLELWQERLPAHLRHKAPHIEVRDGKRLMIQDGMRPKKMAMGSDEKTEEDKLREQGRQQGWDVGYRLNAQDIDGVGAEVVYPGTFGLEMACSPDAEFQGEVARVYNDWTTELFGSRRDRFAMAALIPVIDIPWACQEMRRAAGLGMGSFFLPSVVDPPYNRVEYKPIWETVEETGVPLNFHISSGRDPRVERGPGGAVINYIMGALVDGIELLVYLCSSGVLMDHPKMDFVIVESGAGWLAWELHAMDEAYQKHHMYARPKLDMLPSEYFKRQGYVTFGDDPVAMTTLDYYGPERLLWGNDYPHHEGTWPHSREVVERQFAGISEDAKRKIVRENAAALYGFAVN